MEKKDRAEGADSDGERKEECKTDKDGINGKGREEESKEEGREADKRDP